MFDSASTCTEKKESFEAKLNPHVKYNGHMYSKIKVEVVEYHPTEVGCDPVHVDALLMGVPLNAKGLPDKRASVSDIYSENAKFFVASVFVKSLGHESLAKTLMGMWRHRMYRPFDHLDDDFSSEVVEAYVSKAVQEIEAAFGITGDWKVS